MRILLSFFSVHHRPIGLVASVFTGSSFGSAGATLAVMVLGCSVVAAGKVGRATGLRSSVVTGSGSVLASVFGSNLGSALGAGCGCTTVSTADEVCAGVTRVCTGAAGAWTGAAATGAGASAAG